jgi:hypothetical protein
LGLAFHNVDAGFWVEDNLVECAVEEVRVKTVYKGLLACACLVLLLCEVTLAARQAKVQEESVPRKASPRDLDRKLQLLAGEGAIFCGHVGLEGNPNAANKCVLKAFKEKQPFYVSYDALKTGPSDFVVSGLARDPEGRMWSASFSPVTMHQTYGGELSDDLHILTKPCPTPYRLLEGRGGGLMRPGWKLGPIRISCFPFQK